MRNECMGTRVMPIGNVNEYNDYYNKLIVE